MRTIGEHLYYFRKNARLTQKELAVLSSIPQSTISAVEKNNRDISAVSLYDLSKAMGIHICSFFDEESHHSTEFIAGLLDGLTENQINLIRQVAQQMKQTTIIYQKELVGDAAAGSPIFAPDISGTLVPVPDKFLDSRYFVVSARGDSMEPKIMNGDFVVVQKDAPCESGDIVLARIDSAAEDEYMIKRFFPHGKKVEFKSINDTYKPIVCSSSNVQSVEKVVYVIHR